MYERYLGLANRPAGEVLSANHAFLLASVSKVLIAKILLQLYERGNFTLDDPINPHTALRMSQPQIPHLDPTVDLHLFRLHEGLEAISKIKFVFKSCGSAFNQIDVKQGTVRVSHAGGEETTRASEMTLRRTVIATPAWFPTGGSVP